MPQKSALFGVSRIRSAERALISRERMARLAELSAADALRLLVESGYGTLQEATPEDSEALIASELARASELVREVTTDEEQTNLFFMEADIHNLKLLLKLRLTGSKQEPALAAGGVYDARLLARCVEEADYSPLPETIKAALDEIERNVACGAIDPAALSAALDDAYIRFAYEKGDAFVKRYFRVFADFTNVATLLRVRAMKGARERFLSLLLAPGDVSHDALAAAFELADDALIRALCDAPGRDALARGMEIALKTGRISALERERDNALMRLATAHKPETDTIGPIYGYLLAKKQEARDLRLILTAKRNGLSREVIDERMRLLYGE